MKLREGSCTQVAYVVRDLDAAIDRWARTLGAGPFYVFDNVTEHTLYRGEPAGESSIGAMGFLGATNIELLQQTNDAPSIYREILDTLGDGAVHHVLPRLRPMSAADFDAECARYDAAGLVVAKSGVVPYLGRVAYYDALADLAQFIEVLEWSPASYRTMDRMYQAHLEWDGSAPRRELADLAAMDSGTSTTLTSPERGEAS